MELALYPELFSIFLAMSKQLRREQGDRDRERGVESKERGRCSSLGGSRTLSKALSTALKVRTFTSSCILSLPFSLMNFHVITLSVEGPRWESGSRERSESEENKTLRDSQYRAWTFS